MSARLTLLLLASLLAAPCALAGDYLPDPELVARSIAQQPEVRAAAARVQAAEPLHVRDGERHHRVG